MIRGKKGGAGGVFWIGFIITFFALTGAMIYLIGKSSESYKHKPGYTAMVVLNSMEYAEAVRYYIREAGISSLRDTLYETSQGTARFLKDCGSYKGYRQWNTIDEECYPREDSMDSRLIGEVSKKMNDSLYLYTDEPIPAIDYDYTLEKESGRTTLIAKARKKLRMDISEGEVLGFRLDELKAKGPSDISVPEIEKDRLGYYYIDPSFTAEADMDLAAYSQAAADARALVQLCSRSLDLKTCLISFQPRNWHFSTCDNTDPIIPNEDISERTVRFCIPTGAKSYRYDLFSPAQLEIRFALYFSKHEEYLGTYSGCTCGDGCGDTWDNPDDSDGNPCTGYYYFIPSEGGKCCNRAYTGPDFLKPAGCPGSSACQGSPALSPCPDKISVYVFGDSITEGARLCSKLQAQFNAAPDFSGKVTVTYSGVSGETATQSVDRVPLIIAAKPDIALLWHGMNQGGGASSYGTAYGEVIDSLLAEGITPVIMTPVYVCRDTHRDWDSYFESLNTRIGELQSQHPGKVFVIDIREQMISAHESGASCDSWFSGDDIHPSCSGQDLIAREIVEKFQEWKNTGSGPFRCT